MDIERYVYEVIEQIKALPVKQTCPDSGLKTVWDEFKFEKQFQQYDSFSLHEDTIQSMVVNKIKKEDDADIEILHYFFNREYYSRKGLAIKRKEVIDKIVYQIHIIAQDEEIDYPKRFNLLLHDMETKRKVEEKRRRLKKCYYTLVLASATLKGITFLDALGMTRNRLELKRRQESLKSP